MKLVEGFSWHRVLVRSTEWLVSLNVLKGLNKDSARPHMWQAAMVEVCSKLSVELVIVCTRGSCGVSFNGKYVAVYSIGLLFIKPV